MIAETQNSGVRTNLAFLSRILAHPAFAAAELDTDFIPRHEKDLFITPSELPAAFWNLAGRAWALSQEKRIRNDDQTSQWALASGWRSAQPQLYTLNLQTGEQQQKVVLYADDLTHTKLVNDQLIVEDTHISQHYPALRIGQTLYLEWQGELHPVTEVDFIAQAAASSQQQGGLTAPMNGNIVQILVTPGQAVVQGATLVVLEAMKMEHSIIAPHAGIVQNIFCAEGEMVKDGMVLVELDGGE